ncbi:MAG: hypothetical protein ACTFAL_08200 [Candidatus Electronema sp. V4]|uniref:hypothetical protein n=1 Tax=Candidatus Electronema sp. V4 TaxID=3454756 RepID=UPI00405549BD
MKPLMRKALLSAAGILAAILLLLSPALKLPVLDDQADAYFRAAISKGGLSYATCRVINASVSIIEESSLHLQPAGVGVSLAVGQALDPIDDLTERVSDVLVTAVISLGVQKLAYEIGISLAPPALAVLLLLLSLLIWFGGERTHFAQKMLLRFSLLLFAARFCLPVSSLINEAVNKNFFNDRIEQVGRNLNASSAGFDKLKDFNLPDGGIFGAAAFLKQKSAELREALTEVSKNIGSLTENLLQLAFLYLGIFLIQVIILPLAAFFVLAKTANAMFGTNIPLMPAASSVQD